MATDTRPPEAHDIYVGEEAIVYCFDFSDDPSVTAGATLANPAVTTSNGRVQSTQTPAVLLAEFDHLDRNGNVVGSVAAGKGIKATLTGVSRGYCEVTCKAEASDGQKPEVKAAFTVR